MKHKARTGSRINDDQAKILGNFIEKNFKTIPLTAKSLLESAQSKDSEIHSFFEWDDKIAGHKYRLQQAGMYIKSVVVITHGTELPIYYNVHITEDSPREYVDLNTAKSNDYLWSQVVNQAMKEVKAWAERFKAYKELRPIVEVIHKTERKLKNGSHRNNAA